MSKTIAGLRLFQWGQEVDGTPGTAVAATSKLAVNDIKFTPLDAIARPKLAKGLVIDNPGNETPVTRGTRFSVPDSPVSYDQIHNWLGMAVSETPAATGVNPYTWTHVRDIAADPDINTRTLERRITDGANPIDNEWAYAFLESITFKYKPDQPLIFSADGFARRVQGSTLTGAQAFPTIEIPPSALAQVHIDSTWANLGVTLVSAQVLGAEVKFKTGYKPKMSLDGRSDLDFTTHLLDANAVGLDITLRMLIEASSGQFATEKAAAEATPPTLRALRIRVLGTSSRELRLDMLCKHVPGSIQELGEEDGADVVEMKLTSATDGTNFFRVVTVNATNSTN